MISSLKIMFLRRDYTIFTTILRASWRREHYHPIESIVWKSDISLLNQLTEEATRIKFILNDIF